MAAHINVNICDYSIYPGRDGNRMLDQMQIQTYSEVGLPNYLLCVFMISRKAICKVVYRALVATNKGFTSSLVTVAITGYQLFVGHRIEDFRRQFWIKRGSGSWLLAIDCLHGTLLF